MGKGERGDLGLGVRESSRSHLSPLSPIGPLGEIGATGGAEDRGKGEESGRYGFRVRKVDLVAPIDPSPLCP